MKRLGYTYNGVEWRPGEASASSSSNDGPRSEDPSEASSYGGNLRDVPYVLNC